MLIYRGNFSKFPKQKSKRLHPLNELNKGDYSNLILLQRKSIHLVAKIMYLINYWAKAEINIRPSTKNILTKQGGTLLP